MCTENVKMKLFTTYSTCLYTAQVWTNYTKSYIRRMYVAYDNAARLLFRLSRRCSASEMFAIRHVISCQANIQKILYMVFLCIDKSNNCIIRALLDSDIWFHSRCATIGCPVSILNRLRINFVSFSLFVSCVHCLCTCFFYID